MSAILSQNDLNDFISPGVACIKPVETLPAAPSEPSYEVTTEDAVAAANPPPATISLTDCLACSGCVTSAETVLISLQSHSEVLSVLNSAPTASLSSLGGPSESSHIPADAKVFVASISPQIRASLAAAYNVTERQAGFMVEQLLCGPDGVARGNAHGNRFAWVVDTNAMREVCLSKEAEAASTFSAKRPMLASACPGWICYVEKKRPEALAHLSPLKSPQALTGTLLKSVLAARLGLHPSRVWHVAVMPCFDKKLEASRRELTDEQWLPPGLDATATGLVRDVDCVITPRELLAVAEACGVDFASLPRKPLALCDRAPFPDKAVASFLFPQQSRRSNGPSTGPGAGTSGGYLQHVLATQAARHPDAVVRSRQGRKIHNVHEVVWEVCVPDGDAEPSRVVFRAKHVYGFNSIINFTNKLRQAAGAGAMGKKSLAKKAAPEEPFDYIEVMACAGGCTNGGGQIRLDELPELRAREKPTSDRREWLKYVDEAYFSMSDSDEEGSGDTGSIVGMSNGNGQADAMEGVKISDTVNGISPSRINEFVKHWEAVTGVPHDKLLFTTFKEVKSDVGKKATKTEQAAALLTGGVVW